MDPCNHANMPYRHWLPHALGCLEEQQAPTDVTWTPHGERQRGLFDSPTTSSPPTHQRTLSRNFVSGARVIACHKDPQRWDCLYRILWRWHIGGEDTLLKQSGDADVRRWETLYHAVVMDMSHMKGFLRFQEISQTTPEDVQLVAHYEPDHQILGFVAPHFTQRLGDTSWAILTPQASVTYRKGHYHFGPGINKSPSIDRDSIAVLWQRYYQETYNPERHNTPLFDRTMPKRYRKHMTEASVIEQIESSDKEVGRGAL